MAAGVFSYTLSWGILALAILAAQAHSSRVPLTHSHSPAHTHSKADLVQIPNMADHVKSLLQRLNDHSSVASNLNASPGLQAISSECMAHLDGWAENFGSLWSIQMFDAMSKIPEGILSGHTSSFGDFDECLAVRGEMSVSGIQSDFKGQYCGAYVVPEHFCQVPEGESTTEGYKVAQAMLGAIFEMGIYPGAALCTPSKCSMSDFQAFLNTATNNTGACVSLSSCQTDDGPKLTAGDIFMIIILSLIGALCIIGTTVDLSIPEKVEVGSGSARRSKPVQVLVAFSFYTNTKKWLNTSGGSDNLGCIHGIRFLSTCWVVLAHTWSTWMIKVWNIMDLLNTHKDWTIYPIINGTVSVDTFFTLSGLLVAYNVMKMLDKTKGRLNVPMFYLHRYLRLTPTYAILIGIMATLFQYMKPGPHTIELAHAAQSCRENWWHNLLYINNLISYDMMDASKAMCHGESWYLGNDMQFFLVSPLLLLPLWKWPIVGSAIMGLFTLASVVVPFTVTYTDKLFATLIPTSMSEQGMQDYFDKSYTKPWMRFGPYIAGLWAGYLLYKVRTSRTPIRLPKLAVILGWTVSTAAALAIIFGMMPFFDPEEEYRRLGSAFYAGLHRFGWGAVISWVVLACTMGYGGFINTFLSWKVFIPLGRLSFCVYMISYWLQSLYYFSARQSITYDLYTGINHFFSHMVMSLLISFIACMAFESPFIALEKIIFGQDKKPVKPKIIEAKSSPFDSDRASESSINKSNDDGRGSTEALSNEKV